MADNPRATSFEPRVGIAQMVFGIIYAFLTGIFCVLAYKVWQADLERGVNEIPALQIVFVALFGFLAAKSFFIYARIRVLYETGEHTVGRVESIVPQRGITIVTGTIDINDRECITVESRFAGEAVAHELQRFLDDHKTKYLPALVVDKKGKHPRGMFVVKTYAGHLDKDCVNQLKTNRH